MLHQGARVNPDDLLAEELHADWALAARERVLADACLLEQIRSRLLLQRGRDREALESFEYLLQLDPYSEGTARHAMEVANDIGEPQRALQIFSRLQRFLDEELGVQPSEATKRLYEQIARIRLDRSPSDAAAELTDAGDYGTSWSGMKVAAVPPGQPPMFLSSFVGREREVNDITGLLRTTRLVSLRGMGGVGKTRLAAHVVHHVSDMGVHWADLGSVDEGDLVPHVLATAVGVRPQAGTPILEAVCDGLRSREAILVLDNCEHLLEAVRPCVIQILRTCPGVRILTTTRVALGIEGEMVYTVVAFPVIDVDGAISEGAVTNAAVQLFSDRARAVRSHFQLTADNASDIVHICRRLDGIPLAIEMAASRVDVFTEAQIAARLDERFDLLCNGHATEPWRHRSLRALIAWSYDLAPERVRRLWRRLSILR